jgi:transposase-like protein
MKHGRSYRFLGEVWYLGRQIFAGESLMIRFPITDLLDEQECYDYLVRTLHPEGLHCRNGHSLPPNQAPQDRSRAPICDYRCRVCGNVFNLFTDTVWAGTHYDCVTIVLVMRGFAQGLPTLQLADELELDDETLLNRRHDVQQLALDHKPTPPITDAISEADEMFQNAGEKGEKHDDPDDPPRRRANNRPGAGTMDNDRPPVLGVVGRTTGQIRLMVSDNTQQATLQPKVEKNTLPITVLNTDESKAYDHIADTGRGHVTVCHSRHEYARDDDGDGFCEVHCNTMEGIWTGLRNFLRPFRGVHKKYLAAYVAMFEWAHNLKRVVAGFLRTLMMPSFTYLPT